MSAEFFLRLLGMLIFAFLGGYLGGQAAHLNPSQGMLFVTTFGLVGALAGLILTPYLTTRPARALRSVLGRVSAETLF